MSAAAHLPELEAYYYEQCKEHGTKGFYSHPGADFRLTYLAEDPDRTWAELGRYFLHEATTYASWQTPDIKSAVHSQARTPDELRAEGIYEVITPEEAVARGSDAEFTLHPLVGGMPIDEAWKSVTLFVEHVVPKL
jgi:hypothetical protein